MTTEQEWIVDKLKTALGAHCGGDVHFNDMSWASRAIGCVAATWRKPGRMEYRPTDFIWKMVHLGVSISKKELDLDGIRFNGGDESERRLAALIADKMADAMEGARRMGFDPKAGAWRGQRSNA